jgi:hypothetical protein
MSVAAAIAAVERWAYFMRRLLASVAAVGRHVLDESRPRGLIDAVANR